MANTGCIVVRNSQWSQQFLRDWIALKDAPGVMNEQIGFEAVYAIRGVVEMRSKVAIVSPETLNSVAPAMGEQLPHHQVRPTTLSVTQFQSIYVTYLAVLVLTGASSRCRKRCNAADRVSVCGPASVSQSATRGRGSGRTAGGHEGISPAGSGDSVSRMHMRELLCCIC